MFHHLCEQWMMIFHFFVILSEKLPNFNMISHEIAKTTDVYMDFEKLYKLRIGQLNLITFWFNSGHPYLEREPEPIR